MNRHVNGLVDLRSDTVTRPTPAMRRAMADAEVGDDVYGEDPTVNALQDAYAELVGKDAALLVPTGTMANQVALALHEAPGGMLLAGRTSHVVRYEAGAAGVHSRMQVQTLEDSDGRIDPADVATAAQAASFMAPRPAVVCVENTHNAAGGAPWELADLRAVADVGVPVHLDGARLLNACVATGVEAAEYAACASTVWTALSKGLGAPVGSLLAGPADLMAEARTHRQRFGGGMRQAGVLGAAGLVGLRTGVERLAEDHARARRLSEAVASRWPDAGLDPSSVRTNMVIWRHDDLVGLLGHLRAEGVLGGAIGPGRARLVTHPDVDDADVDRACKALAAAPA